jgi:hypothetical protein
MYGTVSERQTVDNMRRERIYRPCYIEILIVATNFI